MVCGFGSSYIGSVRATVSHSSSDGSQESQSSDSDSSFSSDFQIRGPELYLKTSKNCSKLDKIKYYDFSAVFGRFLSPRWSDQFIVFWRNFFTYKGVCTIFVAISDTVPGLGYKFCFCICSPKPNCKFLEYRQIRYWKKMFFHTPYCKACSVACSVATSILLSPTLSILPASNQNVKFYLEIVSE